MNVLHACIHDRHWIHGARKHTLSPGGDGATQGEFAGASSSAAAALWADYVPSWTFWNHVRCATSCLASLLFTLAFAHKPTHEGGAPS